MGLFIPLAPDKQDSFEALPLVSLPTPFPGICLLVTTEMSLSPEAIPESQTDVAG